MADLSVKYLGLNLKNPIVVGSCGLTDNIDSLLNIESGGAAAVVIKSLFEEEILAEMKANINKMNSDMFLYPETVDYYEYLDAPKESPELYLQLIADAKSKLSIPVIASINCASAGQWTYFPKRIEEAGADALELNLFILPTDFQRGASDNEKVYFDIIKEVRKQIRIPICLKISPYFSNLGSMVKKFSETGIDGIIMFNRYYSPDIDIDKMEVTSGYVLSSPTDLALSLRWMAIMSQRVNCTLIASSGIHDGKAIIKQHLAGADAVQIASALYKYGPGVIKQMLKELTEWMTKNNFSSINDFKGKLSQSQSTNPAAYERVQFMKFFRDQKPI